MKLTTEQIQSLKQKLNVSKDAVKTQQRLAEDFKSASNDDKAAMVTLSGLKRTTFYRAMKYGSVNARIVSAMSQTLNVSPFYYTGEDNTRQSLQDAFTLLFLQNHGYNKLVEELNQPKQKRGRKARDTVAAVDTADMQFDSVPEDVPASDDAPGYDSLELKITVPDSSEIQQAVEQLNSEEMLLLLNALLIRAKVDKGNAYKLEIIKRILLQ